LTPINYSNPSWVETDWQIISDNDILAVNIRYPLPAGQYYAIDTAIQALQPDEYKESLFITFEDKADHCQMWQFNGSAADEAHIKNPIYWQNYTASDKADKDFVKDTDNYVIGDIVSSYVDNKTLNIKKTAVSADKEGNTKEYDFDVIMGDNVELEALSQNKIKLNIGNEINERITGDNKLIDWSRNAHIIADGEGLINGGELNVWLSTDPEPDGYRRAWKEDGTQLLQREALDRTIGQIWFVDENNALIGVGDVVEISPDASNPSMIVAVTIWETDSLKAVIHDDTLTGNGTNIEPLSVVNQAIWGNITGDLSCQTDLNNSLSSKATATDLESEIGEREEADKTLQNNIDAVQSNLDTEADNRETGDADTLLSANLYADEKTEETLDAAKKYADDQIAQAEMGGQTWLPAVKTLEELENITPPEPDKANYLCRVMNDPDKDNNGVYQRIAGAAEWTYFSDNLDFVDENELETALESKADIIYVNGIEGELLDEIANIC
jgi:hypothetical protein